MKTKQQQGSSFVSENSIFFAAFTFFAFQVPPCGTSRVQVWLRRLHNWLFLALFSANFGVMLLSRDLFRGAGGVTWMADVGFLVSINVANIVVLAESNWNQALQQSLIRTVAQIDAHLRLKYRFRAGRRDAFVFLTLVFITLLTFVVPLANARSPQHLLQQLQLIIPCCSMHVKSLQILFYLNAVSTRLETFNKQRQVASSDLTSDEVLHAKQLLCLLTDACAALNGAFGWSLVFLFLSFFFNITCNLYLVFTVLSGLPSEATILDCMTFQIPVVIFLFGLTHVAAKCESNTRCIITSLHERNSLQEVGLNALVAEVTQQAVQNKFVVTAKEFFNVEPGVVQSMLGAIFTYLIILIQFQQKERTD